MPVTWQSIKLRWRSSAQGCAHYNHQHYSSTQNHRIAKRENKLSNHCRLSGCRGRHNNAVAVAPTSFLYISVRWLSLQSDLERGDFVNKSIRAGATSLSTHIEHFFSRSRATTAATRYLLLSRRFSASESRWRQPRPGIVSYYELIEQSLMTL